MRTLSLDRRAELGIIQVMLTRFSSHRLPYALQLKAHVDRGERLSEYDLRFLNKMLEESAYACRLAAKHMKYEELVGRVTSLITQIVSQALDNERASHSS